MPNETPTPEPKIKVKVIIDNVTGLITWEGLDDFNVSVPDLLLIEDWDERSELDRTASVHGIKQKVNDSRAGLTLEKGNSLQDMIDVMQEVIEHIAEGQWNKTKEGGKGKTLGLTKFISTLRLAGQSPEQIIELGKTLYPEVDWSKQTV